MIVPDTKWQPELKAAVKSKYKALAEAIREGIVSGQLPAGSKLPPVRELAYRVGVTPGTVARAYSLVTDEGRLIAEVGRGTFVAGPERPTPVQDVPLVNDVDESIADFRSSRVPDVGQGVLIDDAMMQVARSHRRRHINYPTDQTDLEAREALIGWLDSIDLGSVTSDDITLANGAQNACLLTLMAVLSGPAPVILCEELAYPGVRHAARLLRAKVVGVAMDDDGIIPEALEHAYRNHGGQVLLTVADVHSPTTITTPMARKQAIADVARKLNLTIIEDDCYGTGQSRVPSYRALLPEKAYYISSLTKSISGALRFGFAVAPQTKGAALRYVGQSAHYGVAQPITDLCTLMLNSGVAAQIRADVTAVVARRVRHTVNVLGGWDLKWREDAPFVWLTMPQGWRASSFLAACEARGILIKAADEFVLPDGRAPNAVRLAIGTCVSEPQFAAALDEINRLLSQPSGRIDN